MRCSFGDVLDWRAQLIMSEVWVHGAEREVHARETVTEP